MGSITDKKKISTLDGILIFQLDHEIDGCVLQVEAYSTIICMQWAICRFRFVSHGKQPSSSAVFHFMLSILL